MQKSMQNASHHCNIKACNRLPECLVKDPLCEGKQSRFKRSSKDIVICIKNRNMRVERVNLDCSDFENKPSVWELVDLKWTSEELYMIMCVIKNEYPQQSKEHIVVNFVDRLKYLIQFFFI